MALSKFSITFILSVLSIYAVHAAHHHPNASAPSPSSSDINCWTSLIPSMIDCLSFVQRGGQASKPEGTCCSAFKTVINTKAECLCEGFKSSPIEVNMTKASTLPALCNVPASSVPKCISSLTPAAAPGVQPSTGAPSAAPGGASGAAPEPAAEKSGSPVLSVPVGSLVIGLIIMLV